MTEVDQERARLAEWLARRLGVTAIDIDGMKRPEAGHASDMRMFVARWRDAAGEQEHRLIARVQPDEEHGLFLDMDIMREAAVIDALGRSTQIPVPAVLMTEAASDVFGRPFFVMEHIDGRVPPDEPCYHVGGYLAEELGEPERARLWLNGTATLAQIHCVDWRDKFHFLDRPSRGEHGIDQYVDWVASWYRWVQRGRDHAVMDAALDFLVARKPPATCDGVIWGDARIGNMIFAEDQSVAAVIDWDMVALGPGEVDLGWWLVMDQLASASLGRPRLAGLPDRATTIGHYESYRGREVGDLFYYEVLAAFRFAIVLLRFSFQFQGTPLFDDDSTFGTQSHAVRLVADLLGLPVPELSPDIAKAFMADRPGGAHASRSQGR